MARSFILFAIFDPIITCTMKRHLFLLNFAAVILACNPQYRDFDLSAVLESLPDHTASYSFAEPDSAYTTHLNLNISVDFDNKSIRGIAAYSIENRSSKHILFDIKDLRIRRVLINHPDKKDMLQEVDFKVIEGDEFGDILEVPIEPFTTSVNILYETDSTAQAIHWLSPEQTHDKLHNFMYTQGFSIQTRSWIPIQDRPDLRITWDAYVSVPRGYTLVMSGKKMKNQHPMEPQGFRQQKPVSPYLIAMAVGHLDYYSISSKTGIYAEPKLLDKAIDSFEQLDTLVVVAESIAGDYEWGNFELLFLPPSFPYGGMENPNVVFLNASSIAGNRPQLDLVAHELAHSWAGNLVSFSDWEDLWISEGWATYLEHRILEKILGEKETRQIVWLEQKRAIERFTGLDSGRTKLHMQLDGRHPDEGLTFVPYQKGAMFLHWLEKEAGRADFDRFMQSYFKRFAWKSINSKTFLTTLDTSDLKFDRRTAYEWIYHASVPTSFELDGDSTIMQATSLWEEAFYANKTSFPTLNDTEKYYLLDQIYASIIRFEMDAGNGFKASELDDFLALSTSKNPEVLWRWYCIQIAMGETENKETIKRYSKRVGRLKYIVPLYEAMIYQPELFNRREWYEEAKSNYHATTKRALENVLSTS
jgi:leukotriene-A4 hydrolase